MEKESFGKWFDALFGNGPAVFGVCLVFCLMALTLSCHAGKEHFKSDSVDKNRSAPVQFQSGRVQSDPVGEWIRQGDVLYGQGDFRGAGNLFEKAMEAINDRIEMDRCLGVAVKLAECHKRLGYHKRALALFKDTLPLLRLSRDRYLNVIFLSALADVYFSLGKIEPTVTWLTAALEEARLAKNPILLASVFNDLGNGLVFSERFQAGMEAYDQSIELIGADDAPGSVELKIKTLINKIRLLYLMGESKKALNLIGATAREIKRFPHDDRLARHQKISVIVSFSDVMDEAMKSAPGRQAKRRLFAVSETTLARGLEMAENLENPRILSLINGRLGRLYETRTGARNLKKAKTFTGKAIFFAGQSASPELLYLWQWQMGRLFAAEKKMEKAIGFYRQSIETLNPIRSDLFSGYRRQKDVFNLRVKPVYLELADIFLKQAEQALDPVASTKKMYEARQTMEILKIAELQDFFKDECSAAIEKDPSKLERTPEGTALLYPVLMKNRLVVLATFPDGIMQKNVKVGRKEVRRAATRLRTGLQNRTKKTFIYDSIQLYDWLVRPFESEFESRQIDTLVIVPDGALRLIPFSTLYDGKRFLIERYAIGTAPGIALIKPGARGLEKNAKILVTGLSDAVQGFSALPNIKAELNDIKEIMNATAFYFNQDHNLENLTREFRNTDYSIVHMATHGVFGDSPENTFLLLYENKLTMDALSGLMSMGKYRGKSVDLLTLSACQTAMGDERAALGLAGSAVKAGVKSVVATLWFVDDEATSILIREFYRQLKIPNITKSKALMNAQNSLLIKKRYRHPAYWAPFLLIGNWM